VDALSVDETKQGVFLGGLILPGLSLMQNSLLENAANITELETGTWHSFPLNTNNAIYSGALSAMAGSVKSMYDKLKHHVGKAPLCVLSGGDGQLLLDHLRVEFLIEPEQLIFTENLILKGLYFLENCLTESQSL
jgi:type III pantothenate kinase